MSYKDQKQSTQKLVRMAFLAALVAVLQIVAYYARISTIPVSLVLIPITIGAMSGGIGSGAFLGGVFSVVCLITSFTGIDQAGFYLLEVNAVWTVLLILVKGIAAGAASGAVYRLMRKLSVPTLPSSVVAAVVTPVVNTGLFLVGMYVFFEETLTMWAGGSSAFLTVLTTVVGINFVVELLTTVVLTPAIVLSLTKNKMTKNMFN